MKKNRYLFVNYIQRPRDPKKTHIKGYIKDPANMQWDEIVGFSVGLKSKDQLNSRIVIDIDGQKIIKNTVNDNDNWAQLMDYYLKNYKDQVVEFLQRTGGVS
jgi:hypothetical protein